MPCKLENFLKCFPTSNSPSLAVSFVDILKIESATEKKGNVPYSYVDSFLKLKEATLPSSEKWKNSLKENKVEIRPHDLDQRKKLSS